MYRKTVTTIILIMVSSMSLAGASVPDDYLVPGRQNLFDGTLSGVRQAYQIFTNGINDPNCTNNRELRFFHAASGTAMLAFRDDGLPINSFFELAGVFGMVFKGDNWSLLDVNVPRDEHDAYKIPAGAPDADEVRAILKTSMVPDVDSLIDDLNLINDSPPFKILLDPNETHVFSDPILPKLQYDIEIDYGEVLLLKGILTALKAQLQAKPAYDLYLDPNDNILEKLNNNSFNMNNDLLSPYPDFLKVLPTANDPNIGKAALAQSRQDLITAIDYYFATVDYLRNESDSQQDDFLYIDPNDQHNMDAVSSRLTILRDSLANDTVGTYPWLTTKTYDLKNSGSATIGQLIVEYDISGSEGNTGSLTFTDGTPTPWQVNWVGREGANLISVDVEYFESGQWRQGILGGTLSQDSSTITNAAFQYWGQVSGTLSNLSGNLVSTQIVDAHLDLNPLYGSTARYPDPVSPRALLPVFDEWNGMLPGTMGHGLNDDATLGWILPDMTQFDWQVLLGLQPAGLKNIPWGTATLDGNISEWNALQPVLNDISGDTEDEPNPISGLDIDKLYLSYDSQYLYGAITLFSNIDASINYTYDFDLSYLPGDDSLGTISLQIYVSNGFASTQLMHKDNPNGYPQWISDTGSDAAAGSNAVEFLIPLLTIPGGVAGRFITLESWGWNPSTFEWYDGEWNDTHLKVEGLGGNNLGTISGTVTYNDHIPGAPIFVQAYIDQWDPEGSIVASTMITTPGNYTLTGIGIGWEGYVRAYTPLFGFNIFDVDALTIEASTSVTLNSSTLSGVNLNLDPGKPATLVEDTWVSGQIPSNTYEKLYAFNAQKGTVYALDLNRITSQSACMSLCARDGHTELEERYFGKWQHINWICPETGTYYIRVSNNYQNDNGTYQLRIAQQNAMPSGYEVWGGNTDYTSETNHWEYYYNIDKQNYVKLGDSSGGSATFDGNYTYYVIATHEPIAIDCVSCPNAQIYSGSPWTAGNTLYPWNITGSPDNQYAIVGYQDSGGTFKGFVIINNPGNWDSLTVTVPETGSISGKVVQNSSNIGMEGVRVELYSGDDENSADEDAWNPEGTVYTNSNGIYSFNFLPQRRYRIRIPDQDVSGEHYFEANIYDVQVNEGAETPNINANIRQAALIYGYVRTNNGDPISNAMLIAEASWTHDGRSWYNTWTNPEGRYEFWVAPSPGKFYPIWVQQASWGGTNYACEWDGNFYQATIGTDTQIPDYMLQPGGTVTGRVVNESGVGIEGVWLGVEWSQGGEGIGPWTETDSNGDFTLRGVVPGMNYIRLNNDWREIQQNGVKYMVGEVCSGPVSVNAGGSVDVGAFTIYEAGTITGVVTDEAGFPIVDAEVNVDGRDIDGNWADRDEVITDAYGQFTLDYVAPGTYSLSCNKDGFIRCVETGIVVERNQHIDHDMVMKSANEGATISGTITNYVDIVPYDSGGIQLPSYEDNSYTEYGYGEFGLLAISMQHNYTADDLLNIDNLFVGFADQEDIDDGYGDYFEADAAETPGNYEMVLPSGDIALFLYTHQGDSFGEVGYINFCDWKRLNLSKGDIRYNVDFTATTSGTGILKGNINVPTGYNNFPGDWCMIYAFKLDSNGNVINSLPLGDAVAFSGWTKTYEFKNLPAGDYMLKAYARNLPSVIIPLVTVNSGTTAQDIDFTSVSSGTLTGHIADGIDDVSNATVTILENGRQTVTGDSGNYTFTGINTGTYTVKVTALGYADAEADVIIGTDTTTIQHFSLNPYIGSISGTVKDISGANVNGATVVAYNESNDTHKTAQTVGGDFTITGLTPGQYILAVDAGIYGVVVHPDDGSRITLSAGGSEVANITVGTPQPPLFTVNSSASDTTLVVLSMEFYSDQDLLAAPQVSIVPGSGSGTLGSLTSNSALNRFNIDYTADASDTLVRIQIAETTPLISGNPASQTFTFEVTANLVTTSSTNVTNATGGTASIMGTQDNTEIYVPPFAMAGVDDTQALALTIKRYGDPGQAFSGTPGSTASAVYDFEFDQQGVTVDQNHTFTVTMSFQLPVGMTEAEFENSLEIRYFDAGDQQWKTDGISNVRINWLNYTIIFEVSHLTKFAAFVPRVGIIGDFCGSNFGPPDGYVDVWDLMDFAGHWHTTPSDSNWDSTFDLAGPNFGVPDGYIDVWDLMVFADHWHEGEKP